MIRVGTQNEANRIAWLQRALANLPSGHRILDAGAGEQAYRKFCTHLRYVSQDFGQYDPQSSAAGLQMPAWDYGQLDIVSDIADIPEPDGSFDAILCSEVFEHLSDPLAALREFARLLRSGGELIVTAPFCSVTHFAPFHFATGFSRFYYEHHLPRCGFQILELTANGSFFEYLAQEIRRVPSMCVRYAGRRASWLDYVVLGTTLLLLQKWSRRDQGSAEVLAFGYHLRARKQ